MRKTFNKGYNRMIDSVNKKLTRLQEKYLNEIKKYNYNYDEAWQSYLDDYKNLTEKQVDEVLKKVFKKGIYDSPDEFGLPTDEELELEYQNKKKAIQEKRKSALKSKNEKILKETKSKYKKEYSIILNAENIEGLEDLVEDSGKSTTLAGELVRAYNKMYNRYYNDGDVFFEDYGLETCGKSAVFICENVDDVEINNLIFDCPDSLNRDKNDLIDYEDGKYKIFLDDLGDYLFDYIKTNSEKLLKPTKDMFDSEDPDIYFEDIIPTYEFTIDLPYEVQEALENGTIDESDIEWEVNNWLNNSGVVEVGYDYIEISNLTREDVKEFISNYSDMYWEDFIAELPEDEN